MAANTKIKQIDWASQVKKQKDYKKTEVEYQFSNGKKFIRGDNRGVYTS